MWTFFLRRLLALPPLLIVISLLTFLLLQASPGDYFSQLDADPKKSQDFVMELRANAGKVIELKAADRAGELGTFDVGERRYGFDAAGRLLFDGKPADPKNEQRWVKKFAGPDGSTYTVTVEGRVYKWIGAIRGYFEWLWKLVRHGDLGVSYQGRAAVTDIMAARVTNTLLLESLALLIAWCLAIPLGVWSGVKPNSPVDHACGFVSYISLSVPTVFLSLLALLLAYSTKWFPVGDMHDVHADSLSWFGRQKDTAWHLVLPALVVGLTEVAIFMRQMRSQMVETMSSDYIRTARAKGVSHNKVIFKHALRNAINPLVTLFGFSLAALLSGSFLVEVVFNWPGLAQVTVNAVFQRDEPLVMASVLMATLLLVMGNLVADVLLAMVDPRIRLE
jgi:peptide/nickel transport system permease protein